MYHLRSIYPPVFEASPQKKKPAVAVIFWRRATAHLQRHTSGENNVSASEMHCCKHAANFTRREHRILRPNGIAGTQQCGPSPVDDLQAHQQHEGRAQQDSDR